ncbi:MAG: toprim domain-containing protein, partial [Eubacterium sp.]|nr:toprim domain-containing protein [Eubacterium sp.]
RRNHVIGFGGRVMGQGEPKYLNTRDTMVFDKSRNLFGINYIHGKLPDGLILCEGYMDVIALHQAGFTNAVAALGTAFTSQHASLIRRLTEQVYVCFDSDGPGRQAAMKALPLLKKEGIRPRVIDLSPHKDPDEFIKALSAEDFSKRMKDAKIAFFFEIGVIAEKYQMDNPEEKTLFMNEAADRVLTFEDEVERTNYIEAFSREYRVRSEDFRSLVIKRSARMAGRTVREKTPDRDPKSFPVYEDAVTGGQGILLTWLCEHPDQLGKVAVYVTVDDFVDEPYHRVAGLVYDQIEKNGSVDAAGIVSQFENVEEQSMVAGIFHKEVEAGEQNRAISDVIRGILKRSLEHRSARATDINEVQSLLSDKKKLEQLKVEL